MATLLAERQHGSLPSNSEVNPRREGNEHVKVVTLRSGKELVVPGQPLIIGEVETKEVTQTSQNDKIKRENPKRKGLQEKKLRLKIDQPRLNPMFQFRTLNA